jgi:hypothetical protein
LRFSRIFANAKPAVKEQIWYTSRTFKKKVSNPPVSVAPKSLEEEEQAAIASLKQATTTSANLSKLDKITEETADLEKLNLAEMSKKAEEEDKEEQEEQEKPSTSGWDFRFGAPPKKEDCCTDEYVSKQEKNDTY